MYLDEQIETGESLERNSQKHLDLFRVNHELEAAGVQSADAIRRPMGSSRHYSHGICSTCYYFNESIVEDVEEIHQQLDTEEA